MKSRIRTAAGIVALGGIALLSGCVGYPAGSAYDSGYGYGGYSSGYSYGGDPYYSNPVVVAPSVYVQGGRTYDNPRYYGRPGYDRRSDNRPNYRDRDRDHDRRPDAGGQRPGVRPVPDRAPPQVSRPRQPQPQRMLHDQGTNMPDTP